MKLPCEVVAKYVLPATRALTAKKLIEKYGYTQVEAASKLGVTQSAMSRYMASKRGNKIEVLREIHELTDEIAEGIVANKLSEDEILRKICHFCVSFGKTGELCKLHSGAVFTRPKIT